MKKKIAILGASEPHLPLYKTARKMDLEIHAFAWLEGAYCKDYADYFYDISIIDKEAILEKCLELSIDGIISNAIEPAVPTMAYVAEKMGLNGISVVTAELTRNKYLMRMALASVSDILQPKFVLIKKTEDILPKLRFPLIVKPIDSSCSNGVMKVESESELQNAIARAMLISSGKSSCMVEECIDGREISVESISFHGEHHILMITDKETTGAPFFVEIAHHQPANLTEQLWNKVSLINKIVLTTLGVKNGASHAEYKIKDNGDVYLIEIGARGGGDFISYKLVELSTGYDYVRGMIEVALNQFTLPSLSRNNYSGVYFLSKETEPLLEVINQTKKEEWVIESVVETKVLRELRKSQDRSGYIIYKSEEKIILNH